MVHKKYIKRDGKTFGPYLYENYRVKGVTKTRYLGLAKERKKLRVNLFLILGIIFLILLLAGSIGFFVVSDKEELKGELASESPFDFLTKFFTTTSPINVFVQIILDRPPEFLTRPSEIFVCENTPVDETLFVNDTEGDILEMLFSPNTGFSLFFNPYQTSGDVLTEINLFTRILNWRDIDAQRYDGNPNNGWAVYTKTISTREINNPSNSDSFITDIVIIEVNDAPEFNIGVQTVQTKGEGTNFSYDLGSYLESQGEETPKNKLNYSLTYQNGSISLFNISKEGVINITGNESYIPLGNESWNYPLRVCVNDTGLQKILHPKIGICLLGNPPQDEKNKSYCDNFILTITKKNRPPIITSYNPINLSFTAKGNEVLYFNLTAYDPDFTPVDVNWYVDNVSEGHYEGLEKRNISKFETFFYCGVSGEHFVEAIVTDGLLNVSVKWNVSVEYTLCPGPRPPGVEGGGGGGKLYCEEKWGCDEWVQCQNLDELVKKRWLTKETELLIKDRCNLLNYTTEFCGLQNRICTDFNYCKTQINKPPYLRECYYTENPNCTDGIRNCHNEICEVLTDCGGPCNACPTCNDKIKNQGELGIDCGGPCRACIELPWLPVVFKSIITYSLIALLIIILLLIARQIIKYTKFKRIFGESRIKNVLIRGEDKRVKNVVMNLFFIFFIIALLFFANAYIMNVGQANKIISGVPGAGGAGLLASYGFINSIFSNFGMFFVGGPVFSVDSSTKLTIGDDTDGGIMRFSGDNFYFYAEYLTNPGGNPISTGTCIIRFENYTGEFSDWKVMVYNNGKFEYTTQFNYKGTYDFEVNCSTDGSFQDLGFVNASDEFTITNTAPQFMEDAVRTTYNGIEDTPLYHNFFNNFTDPDVNDKWAFSINTINLIDKKNYPWVSLNETSGLLLINSSIDSEAGIFDISMKISDTKEEGNLRNFRFIIQKFNDAPQFVNLENKTFNEGDLFEYLITTSDEEGDDPFKFNISYVSCSNGGDCDLFKGNYTFDEINGRIDISFTPEGSQIGSYIINFSVMDNSSLGNKTTSQLVNFTVTPALWNSSVQLNHLLTEDDRFTFNLTNQTLGIYQADVTFSFNRLNSAFPFFNIINGIIDFIPQDKDVGENFVEITANNGVISSSRIFNFTVLNTNDPPIFQPLTGSEVVTILGLNVFTYENADASLGLNVRDDDFAIPSNQKSFYNENLTINLTIQGPNETLFNFVEEGLGAGINIFSYSASFTPKNESIGSYNITVNITDKSNLSRVLMFNLTILNRSYDKPNINYPDENKEFNMKENATSNLIFRTNHTVGDDLNYLFYIDSVLRSSFLGNGNNSNVTWSFAPGFTDETYENEIKNLTLIVRNPYYSNLYAARNWNLTINHTNCPPIFIKEIQDKGPVSYPYEFGIDLMDYFYDADYYDEHYNNTPEGILNFTVYSNTTDSKLSQRLTSDNWVYIGAFAATVEKLYIRAYDNASSTLSNNFTVTFVPPEIIKEPTPSTKTSTPIPISLKIIMPGQISGWEGDTLRINLQLINTGSKDFNDINLSSLAFKNGSLFNEIKTSLDKTYFKILKPNQEENLTLTVYLGTNKTGRYEILINATSKSPKYTDWGKIHLELMPVNESQVRDLIVFTQELIASSPQCVEITEIIKEADKYLQAEDYANARLKANEALNSCKEAISQVSVPRLRIPDFIKSFKLDSYLFLIVIGTIAIAIIAGLIYYFVKRREIKNIQETIQESKVVDTKV